MSTSANTGYLQARKDALAGSQACTVSGGNQCGFFVKPAAADKSMGLSSQIQCLGGSRTQNCSLLDLAQLRNPTAVQGHDGWDAQGMPLNISIVDFYEVSSTAAQLIAEYD